MKQTLPKLINNYFPSCTERDAEDMDEIREAVRLRIRDFLNGDMQGLLQILYRIDVEEEKVKEILALSDPDKIDSDLAAAVVDRILQKIAFRQKYGN